MTYRRLAAIPRARMYELETLARRMAQHLMPFQPDLAALQYKELCYLRIQVQRQIGLALPPRPRTS